VAAACLALALVVAPLASAQEPGRAAYEIGAHALRTGNGARAVEYLERAYVAAPDNAVVLGLYARALLMTDRPAEAVDILDRLRRIDPQAEDVDLLAGLARYRQGEWAQAVQRLMRARDLNPRSSRAHLFLAAAYQELGAYDQAEAALAEAERIDPALEIIVRYRRALAAARQGRVREASTLLEVVKSRLGDSTMGTAAGAQLELLREQDTTSFTTYAALGFELDSNNNLAGGASSFAISSEKDVRTIFQAGMQGFLYQGDTMVIRGGVEGYLSAQRDLKRLDIQSPSAFLRGSFALADNMTLDLGYELEYTWADMDSFVRTQTVSPALRIRYGRNWATRLSFEQQRRGFFLDTFDPALDRDGDVTLTGVEQLYYVEAGGGGLVRTGIFYRRENSSGNSFDSRGPFGIASLTLSTKGGLSFLVEGTYEVRRHSNPDTFEPSVFVGNRTDRITSGRVSVRYPLTDVLSLQADYQLRHAGSNTPVFDYDRRVAGLRLLYLY
jgi:hypothetical protein